MVYLSSFLVILEIYFGNSTHVTALFVAFGKSKIHRDVKKVVVLYYKDFSYRKRHGFVNSGQSVRASLSSKLTKTP